MEQPVQRDVVEAARRGDHEAFEALAMAAGDRLLFDRYIVDAHGGGLQQIASTPNDDDFAPTWSPDGTTIAFVSARSDGRFVYIVAADRTGEQLVNGAAGPQFAPAWQPLGDRR